MLVSILYIAYHVGSTNLWMIRSYEFSQLEQQLIWIAFFASFAVKIPMVPAHLWLPKAHVEHLLQVVFF